MDKENHYLSHELHTDNAQVSPSIESNVLNEVLLQHAMAIFHHGYRTKFKCNKIQMSSTKHNTSKHTNHLQFLHVCGEGLQDKFQQLRDILWKSQSTMDHPDIISVSIHHGTQEQPDDFFGITAHIKIKP